MIKLQREFESLLKVEGLNEMMIKKYNEKNGDSIERNVSTRTVSVEYESDNEPEDSYESESEENDDATK